MKNQEFAGRAKPEIPEAADRLERQTKTHERRPEQGTASALAGVVFRERPDVCGFLLVTFLLSSRKKKKSLRRGLRRRGRFAVHRHVASQGLRGAGRCIHRVRGDQGHHVPAVGRAGRSPARAVGG